MKQEGNTTRKEVNVLLLVNDIPHLKYHKTKTYMEVDPKVSFMYSVAFMCNDNYQATADMFNNPLIASNHKYGAYYMDFIYRRKVMNKMINLNIKDERTAIYDEVHKSSKTIKGYYTLKSIGKKNFFFDMAKYNEYFFNISKSKPYKVKMEAYIDYLKSILEDKRLVDYKHRTVYLEVDSWINQPFQKLKMVTFDNPIMIFYILMKRNIEKFKELGDINFIIYDKQGQQLRLNPSLCDAKSHMLFKRELVKISAHLSVLDKEGFEETEEKRQEVYNDVLNTVYDYFRFTGKEEAIANNEEVDQSHEAESPDISDELSNSVKERIVKELENTDLTGKDPKKVALEIQDAIFKDSMVVKDFYEEVKQEKIGKSKISTKRDEELRAKQETLMLNGKSFKDIVGFKASAALMETNDVSNKLATTNANVSKVRYPSFEKIYNEKLYKKDS